MGRRGADPDRLLSSAIHGTAWRRATERGSIADAVEELMQIAGGRRDILAETAGITVGSWSAHPSMCVGTELFVGGLLIYAGADLDQLERWFPVGRDRAGVSGPLHG